MGTPAYVYSSAALCSAYSRLAAELRAALRRAPFTICYAVKANSNLAILQLLTRLGAGFDIVSGGELDRLRRIGVVGTRIVFSGVGKTREEIREALAYRPAKRPHAEPGILLFNVESEAELETLAEEAARRSVRPDVSIRVNPDVEAVGHPHISTGHHRHKFGVDWREARRLYVERRGSRWFRWSGISAHIGSQILSIRPIERAADRLASYVKDLSRQGVPLKYVDIGGGLGVRYTREEPPDFKTYARTVARALRPLGVHLLLEPGRALVGAAGVLLTSVLYVKKTRGRTFVIVDAAMNDFLRPALYDAVHPLTHAEVRKRPVIRADIVGPVCETGDVFVRDWRIESPEPGDLLVLWGAGAYGFAAASNYNSRPRPVEVLVEGRRSRVIRRRESRADLLRGE